MLKLSALAALAATMLVTTPMGASAAILTQPGLTGVKVYEITWGTLSQTFAPTDAALTSRLSTLTAANRDFGFFPGDENYDIFISDAAGNVDAQGSHLTIEGNCNVPYGCFNINEVSLVFGATEMFANVLTRAVYGRAGSFASGSAANAVDGNINTYTNLGDTIGMPASSRMAITVGFSNLPTGGAVPEPATWGLMILGFGAAGAILRSRRKADLRPA